MSLLSVSQLKDPICFGIFTGKSRPGAGAGAGAAGALAAAGASAGAPIFLIESLINRSKRLLNFFISVGVQELGKKNNGRCIRTLPTERPRIV